MEWLIFWILCGVGAALIASSKGGSGFLWFIMGILFGPFGLLFAFFAGPSRVDCPHCKSRIREDATVCPNCQRDLSSPAAAEE